MSIDEKPEILVGFWIGKHDLDVDECSRVVGIPPTEVWRQRRADLMYLEGLHNTQWIIDSPRVRSLSVGDEVEHLLKRLSPAQGRIAQFLKESGAVAYISCDVTIYSERPEYRLSAPTIQAIARLGAGFDLGIIDNSGAD